jgi:hypothetical protein
MTLFNRAALAAIVLASAAPAFAQQSDKMMTPATTMPDGKSMTDTAMPDSNMSGKTMETATPASASPMMDSAKAMPESNMGGKMDDMKK